MRRLVHPFVPALLGLVWAAAVAGAFVADTGDVSRFVGASPPWTDPAARPAGLAIVEPGYDGQFYYRLALDPFTDQPSDRGITFDRPAYRQQRILYPLLAWVASGGDERRAPLALVLVNVAAMFAVGWAGGAIARGAGRHALWGALFASYPGFVVSLTNDLTEIVAAALGLAALGLLRSRRDALAVLTLAGAALERETTALLTIAAALARGAATPRRPGQWLPFALPVLLLLAWQAVLAARWGAVPVGQSAEAFDPPFLGIFAAAWLNGERLAGAQAAVWAAAIGVVLGTIVLGARALRAAQLAHERIAWCGYLAVAPILEANIWANGAVLRTLTELGMLTALLALGARPGVRWALLGAYLGLSGLLVATRAPL